MIIEGTLGITASHFLLDFLGERGVLPGFVDGYGRSPPTSSATSPGARYFLRERGRERTPQMADVVSGGCVDLLPAVAESVSPPSEGAWDVLGVEDGALAAYGAERSRAG